jgi:hypothetical protein
MSDITNDLHSQIDNNEKSALTHTPMAKAKLLILIIGIAVIGIIVVVIGVRTKVRILRNPPINKISHQCDDKGLRQADLLSLATEGTEHASVHAVVNLGCDPDKQFDLNNSVFLAVGNIKKDNVQLKWTSPDTLTITYTSDLKVIHKLDKVEFDDATLNVNVKFVVDQVLTKL